MNQKQKGGKNRISVGGGGDCSAAVDWIGRDGGDGRKYFKCFAPQSNFKCIWILHHLNSAENPFGPTNIYNIKTFFKI